MAPPIVFDLLRLFLGPSRTAPRGIDRVDLAYARFLFTNWPGDCVGLLPTPWGLRLYDRRRVMAGLDALEAMWRERSVGPDAVFDEVARRLGGAASQPSVSPANRVRGALPRFTQLLLATGVAVGTPVIGTAAKGAIYLNIGQLGWAAPWMVRWLAQRADIRAVFLLHDAIPLERPDLVTPLGSAMHRRMMGVAARHAAGLIFTTGEAGGAVLRALQPYGQPSPRTTSLHLPVAPSFLAPTEPNAMLAAQNYFIVVGAIEPRKNLLMLLQIWTELLRLRGARTPRLVVAGFPARGGRPILRQLLACGHLRDHVIVTSGLSSPALRQLVENARAVLMPSRAEGFGLPIVEALTVGTPVLASDLPAHREAGGDWAVYLDPADAAGWLAEIGRFADGGASIEALRRRIAGYRPMTPEQYFRGIAEFLRSLG